MRIRPPTAFTEATPPSAAAPNPGRVVTIANAEVVMSLARRFVLALLFVVVDTAAFAVPLASVLLAYILLARPAWFRDWVEQLYRGVSR
jgi:hypothetical protein